MARVDAVRPLPGPRSLFSSVSSKSCEKSSQSEASALSLRLAKCTEGAAL